MLIAQRLAMQIVAVGLGRVQRVVLIGSRARGTARPDSDLDLVVLVELPSDASPWGPADVIAERKRIQHRIPAPPVSADLWVRTTDRYAEARGVIGGVERLVDTEGVEVYSRPQQRAPVVRRTLDQVRRELVSTWVEHTLAALEGTLAMESNRAPRPPVPGQPKSAQDAAHVCAERAANALLVLHQTGAGKGAELPPLVARLGEADRRRVAGWLSAGSQSKETPSRQARRVVGEMLRRLQEDRGMRAYLGPSQERFKRAAAG
jgi:hypothetical protein